MRHEIKAGHVYAGKSGKAQPRYVHSVHRRGCSRVWVTYSNYWEPLLTADRVTVLYKSFQTWTRGIMHEISDIMPQRVAELEHRVWQLERKLSEVTP